MTFWQKLALFACLWTSELSWDIYVISVITDRLKYTSEWYCFPNNFESYHNIWCKMWTESCIAFMYVVRTEIWVSYIITMRHLLLMVQSFLEDDIAGFNMRLFCCENFFLFIRVPSAVHYYHKWIHKKMSMIPVEKNITILPTAYHWCFYHAHTFYCGLISGFFM